MIDRRQLLRRTAGAGTAAAIGMHSFAQWLSRALQHDPASGDGSGYPPPDLAEAYERAVSLGRPLLVFVALEDDQSNRRQAERFVDFLSNGPADALLDLALCEAACATLDSVVEQLGTDPVNLGDAVAETQRKPMLLIVTPTKKRADQPLRPKPRVVAIAPELGQDPTYEELNSDWNAWQKAMQDHRQQIRETIAAALRAKLAPTPGSIGTLADACRDQLTTTDRTALDEFFAGGDAPDDALLIRSAAVVRMAALAPRRPGDDVRLLTPLRSAARDAYVESWKPHYDRLMQVDPCPPCGMARVQTPRCETFLRFYSKE